MMENDYICNDMSVVISCGAETLPRECHGQRSNPENDSKEHTMTKNEMERLLDTVYELEGLLQLALSRDELPGRIPELITAKAAKIARQAAIPPHEETEGTESTPDPDSMTEAETLMADAWDEVEADPDPEPPVVSVVPSVPEPESGLSGGTVAPDAPAEGETNVSDTHTGPEGEPDSGHDTPCHRSGAEVAGETASAGETPVSARVESPRGTLRSRFSLNDRFRFSRALFGGNTSRFDETVRVLEGCVGYDDAEDYLVDDLGWDPEADDDAAEFVERLRNWFDV